VTNTLNCLPTANLIVTKTVLNETGATVNFPATTFTANVGCAPTSLVFSANLSLPVPAKNPLPNNQSVSSPPSSPILVPVAAGESCAVTETPPPPPGTWAQQACPSPVYGVPAWYTTITPTPITPIVAGTTYAVTITNTLRCQGLLAVKKVVSPDPAGVGPTTNFTINVTCTPPTGSGVLPTHYTENLLGNGIATSITGLMVGSVCTFQETPPMATFTNNKGQICTWQTQPAYPIYTPPSVTIGLISNVETVTNSYSCQGQTGTLTLIKTADYDGNALALTPVTVSIQVSCTNPTIPTQTVTFTVNNNGTFSQTAPTPIAVGSMCTIIELPVAGWISTPPNCPWTTFYPVGQTIRIQPGNQVLQVVNEEVCPPNPTAAQVGVVELKTPIIDGLVNYTPGVAFFFNVECTSPLGHQYNYSWGGLTGQTFSSSFVVPTNSSCTWTETPPPPLPPGDSACSWQTSYLYNGAAPPGVTNPVAPGTSVTITNMTSPSPGPNNLLTIQNQLICPPATLQVTKTVVNETGQTVNLPATTFTANVGCGPSTQPVSVNLPLTVGPTLNWTSGLPGEVSSQPSQVPVAVGENCTVTETTPLPAVPSGVTCQAGGVPYAATWTTSITPAQPMPITAAGQNSAIVTNMLSCNPLTVTKLVPNDFAGVAGSTQFPITVTCKTPSGVTTSYPPFDVYDNATAPLLAALTVGSTCTFAETPVPVTFPYNGQTCTWQTPTYSKQPLTIASGPNNTETVTNSYTCQFPPVIKPAACTPPMIPGATPGSCICPQGMQLQGNECVAVQKTCPPPMIPGATPGSCVCPQGMQLQGSECVVVQKTCPPPMIPGATPGSCVCPQGMQLQGSECVAVQKTCPPPMIPGATPGSCVCPQGMKLQGKECVRPIVCKSPQIPNPAGTACVCPQGTVQKGRDCVRPIQCRPPMIPNAAATACMCPQGTVQRGQECVSPGGYPGRGGGGGGGGRR
jgi:hypothetical protein